MKSYIASKRKNLEEFLEKNKTFVLPTVILGGFVIDTLTLGQVDRAFDNFVILFHLFVVGTSIALLFSVDSRLGRKLRLSNYDSTIQTLMLFSLGGLFSGFTVFYAKSGSLISSWPFILIMIAVMLGTEIQKKHFQKVIFQVSLFYVAIFSYLIFSLPVLVRKMGPDIYMLSGVAGLCVMVFYLFVLSKLNKTLFVKYKKPIIIRIISIFFIFNFLYFANIIPPIPLSTRPIPRSLDPDAHLAWRCVVVCRSRPEHSQHVDGDALWRVARLRLGLSTGVALVLPTCSVIGRLRVVVYLR